MASGSHGSIWTIRTWNYSHLGDIGGKQSTTEPPSNMGIPDQKWKMTLARDRYGPTEHGLYPSLPDWGIECALLVPSIPTNCYNLKLQSLGWLCMPQVATESPSDIEIFLPKRTTSSHRLGPIEDLSWIHSPKLDVWHVPLVSLIHTNHSSLKFQPLGWHWRTRTCRWTWTPLRLRHGDFRLKKTLIRKPL